MGKVLSDRTCVWEDPRRPVSDSTVLVVVVILSPVVDETLCEERRLLLRQDLWSPVVPPMSWEDLATRVMSAPYTRRPPSHRTVRGTSTVPALTQGLGGNGVTFAAWCSTSLATVDEGSHATFNARYTDVVTLAAEPVQVESLSAAGVQCVFRCTRVCVTGVASDEDEVCTEY